MWFMNKVANPLVQLILRSPLHGLMDKSVLLLSYQGRKSGRRITLPVQYARKGNDIYIIPGAPEKKTWWRNLRSGAPVELVIAGKVLHAQASILDCDADAALAVEAFEAYLAKFPAAAPMYKVQKNSGGFDEAGLRQAAKSVVIVHAKM